MSEELKSKSGDYGMLAGMALEQILHGLGRNGKGWTGPDITADSGTYKLDFYAPDYDESGVYLTLYEDGVWQLYLAKDVVEGKITPLHYKTWVSRMTKKGVLGASAFFAVEFFKGLKKKD